MRCNWETPLREGLGRKGQGFGWKVWDKASATKAVATELNGHIDFSLDE